MDDSMGSTPEPPAPSSRLATISLMRSLVGSMMAPPLGLVEVTMGGSSSTATMSFLSIMTDFLLGKAVMP